MKKFGTLTGQRKGKSSRASGVFMIAKDPRSHCNDFLNLEEYSHLPKVFVQTQISTHISSHVFAYHRKYTLNEVSIR